MNLFKEFFLLEKWNIWKSLVLNFIMIVPIAVLNWLYFIFMEKPANLDYTLALIQFIIDTTAVGVFPSIFLLYYLERKLRLKNLRISEKVNQQLASKLTNNSENEELSFNSQNS